MKKIFLIIITTLMVFTSCTVYKEYPIEVYSPGEVVIPSDIENIAIVYRNFKYKNDTLRNYFMKNGWLEKAKNDPSNLDSLLAVKTLEELASSLKERNRFNRIHIFPGIFKPHTGARMPSLKFDLVQKITNNTQTDLVISLETLSYFYVSHTDTDIPSREVITASIWGLYDPGKEKTIERKTMVDTIFWNNYDDQGQYIRGSKLPPRLTALEVATKMAGENYAKRFFSSWQRVNRMYSVPPLPDFEQAGLLFEEGKYDEAIALWKRYSLKKNGKMAINARYNIALAYEVKDELEMAANWLFAAEELAVDLKSKDDIKMVKAYRKVLDKRRKEINVLSGED